MIKPTCDCCAKELDALGALLFSPPLPDNQVTKYHICFDCFYTIHAAHIKFCGKSSCYNRVPQSNWYLTIQQIDRPGIKVIKPFIVMVSKESNGEYIAGWDAAGIWMSGEDEDSALEGLLDYLVGDFKFKIRDESKLGFVLGRSLELMKKHLVLVKERKSKIASNKQVKVAIKKILKQHSGLFKKLADSGD